MKYIQVFTLSLILVASCTREQFEPQRESDAAASSIRAVLPREKQAGTKVQFLDNPGIQMESRWSADDKIGVFGKGSANAPYQIKKEDILYGGKTADFHTTGEIPDGPLTAYYPYQKNAKLNGGVLTVDFPSTQKYSLSKSVSAPDPDAFILAGSGNRSDGLRFLNVTSLLKIGYVPNDNQVVKKVVFTDLEGKPVNGKMNISWSGDEPSAVIESGGSSITLDCGEGVLVTGESLALFWMPVPARNYSKGFRISFILKDGSSIDKTVGTAYGKKLYRNTVHPVGDIPAVQSDSPDISYELKENVVIMSQDMMELIRNASIDSDVVPAASGNGSFVIMNVLAAYAHKDLALKKDDYVIINQASELFPNGFIGQVTEYTPTGDEARIRIRQCQDFSEPFKKLKLGKPVYNADGSVAEGGGIELDLASSLERIETPDGEDLPFDVEGDTLTLYEPVTKAVTSSSYTSPRLRLKTISSKTADGENGPGEMSVGVQLKLSTKFSMGSDDEGNTEYIHFNVNPKVLLTFNVKFSASKDFDALKGERDFGTFYFAPIVVGPVVLRPQVEIGAYCGASASAELNVSYKYVANWGTYGFTYQRGQGFAIRSQVAQPEEEDGINVPEASLSGNIGFSVGLYATPGISLYGLLTANLKSKFGLNFSMGYEAKLDSDGFSRGMYFQLAPEFSLTPMVTTLGGIWTKTWDEWQPLEFDPLWQKYIWPEAKINSIAAVPTYEAPRNFFIDLGGETTRMYLTPISGYRKVRYSMVLKKETLFNVGVGFAIYRSRKFNHWQMSDRDKKYADAGLEDYTSFTLGALEEPFYEKSVAVDYYSGPDDGEDTKTIEGEFDYVFENGYYYTIVPTAFFPSFSTASLMHYDYGDIGQWGTNRHSFVCHWPYLSNGELFPENID